MGSVVSVKDKSRGVHVHRVGAYIRGGVCCPLRVTICGGNDNLDEVRLLSGEDRKKIERCDRLECSLMISMLIQSHFVIRAVEHMS